MLQAGVQTKDMDPRWMSSISWYFLCIFGLQFVYVFLLGSDNGMSTSSVLTTKVRTVDFFSQPPARWPSKWLLSRCLRTPWVVPARTLTSNSKLSRRTWLSLSIILSSMMLRSVFLRVSNRKSCYGRLSRDQNDVPCQHCPILIQLMPAIKSSTVPPQTYA